MSRFPALLIPWILLIMAVSFLTGVDYARESKREIQEEKLDVGINYAVDAATEEMILNTSSLDMDYADWERLTIDPEIALDTFLQVMLRNLGWSISDENIESFKTTNLPIFVVAAYDGFYVSRPTKISVSSGAYDQIFSMKQPYLYSEGNEMYALNLGLNDCKLFNGSNIQKVNTPISKDFQKHYINTNISDTFMRVIYEETNMEAAHTVYLPSDLTSISRTNPVNAPTVLAYVNNLYLGPGNTIESFAIGGTRVVHQDFIGGYRRNGIKYYAPTRLIPTGVVIENVYENMTEAAKAGYYYDPLYQK